MTGESGRADLSTAGRVHEFEPLSGKVIAAALAVHRALGPGFLESIYQNAMGIALTNRSIGFETQKAVTIEFEGAEVGIHKLDMVAGGEIVVELKAVKEVVEVHRNQLLSYLRPADLRVGLLINFNSSPLFIKRVVN
jgi:GxxExxY protein